MLRGKLPWLLQRLARIPDPRSPQKIKHQLTVVLLYGLLTFVLRKASRREANQERSRPMFLENLRLLFPELETLPLMSEFLDNAEDAGGGDKQDCELRAFDRMAKRLKEAFPKLPILLLLDGLYANGPVMDACRRNGWQFLIVLQDGSLPGTWDEYRGLGRLEKENGKTHYWGGRRQQFRWVNGIEREYEDPGNRRRARHQVVHVVCEESWEEIAPGSTERVTKRSKHAWLSSEPLTAGTVHERGNLGGRHRWGIEEGFLVEKHHGYQYEHCFSWNWQARKGYHYLMRLAHALNVLALYTTALARRVRELGVRGVLRLVYETLTGPWFDPEVVRARWHQGPLQLRLESQGRRHHGGNRRRVRSPAPGRRPDGGDAAPPRGAAPGSYDQGPTDAPSRPPILSPRGHARWSRSVPPEVVRQRWGRASRFDPGATGPL